MYLDEMGGGNPPLFFPFVSVKSYDFKIKKGFDSCSTD